MESDLRHDHYHLHEYHHKQTSSGLTRYQSAPSSYFSSFLDASSDGGGDEFLNRPPSPETERIFEQFLKSTEEEITEPMEIKLEEGQQPPLPPPERNRSYQRFYNQKPAMGYGAAATATPTGGMERYSPQPPMSTAAKSSEGGVSNLIRHSSSPAGLFNTINLDKDIAEYMVMRGMDDLGDNKANRDSSFAIELRPSPTIQQVGNPSSFGSSSWENSSSFTNDRRTLSHNFDMPDTKNIGVLNRPSRLSHHLSLPKSLSETTEIEKMLQSSDSVPCKIRAKRGCATHPRSIAERVRRTKISNRMKKLQDLVPNMDKQTNTSDMLDLAVEYIKDLQERVKILKEDRARCRCSSM